ncbi:MAG: LPXTG cell wall anchor domain-containing protein [Planctomycetes bacterium]|nr:LPXTG cell wall anchor domain-containing protein [Planctomycetota bacterium]
MNQPKTLHRFRFFPLCLGLSLPLVSFPASGDESPEEPASDSTDDELSPEIRETILDKGKIAEETYQRLVGLREAGNPHIRQGLLLSTIKDDPLKSYVDPEKNRRERIALIERRDPNAPQDEEGEEMEPRVEKPKPPQVPSARAVKDTGDSSSAVVFSILGAALLAAGAAALVAVYWKRRWKKK